MRQFFSLLFLPVLLISLNANALVIRATDVVEASVGFYPTVLELIPQGYNPATDSITHVKLIYDFTEIYSPTNLGDEEDYDGTNPEEAYAYVDEFTLLGSWMFNWRSTYSDLDTGLVVFEKDWTRTDACQFETATDPEVEGTSYCKFNMDVLGNVNAQVISSRGELWLHSITLEVEVDRTAEVSEPNPSLLFGLGLLAIGLLRRRARA